MKRRIICLLALACSMALCSCGGNDSAGDQLSNPSGFIAQAQDALDQTRPKVADELDEANTEIEAIVEPAETVEPFVTIEESESPEVSAVEEGPVTSQSADARLTMGQKNALTSAKNYLGVMAFSHDGLIDQLEYEKYTTEEATYAADNCGADWNEQALESANQYLDYTAFSYAGLIEQLEYEKFTHDQAVYGADHCGADWYEQAALSAASYISFMSFSRDGLIDQLLFEGFTAEQATYGASANGY